MIFAVTPLGWLVALLIFVMRAVDVGLDIIRQIYWVRGLKLLVWGVSFCQAVIFILAVLSVIAGSAGVIGILAYAAGFATGNALGMWLEERLAVGYIRLTVISTRLGAALAEALRMHHFAVTEIPGRGKDGTVTVLNVAVRRTQFDMVETVILETDPDAFMTAEDVHAVRRGFWRA
jgi:uncharacterized protein YebE (UPF0316 family)